MPTGPTQVATRMERIRSASQDTIAAILTGATPDSGMALYEGVAAEQLDQILAPVSIAEFLGSTWGRAHRHVPGWPGKFAQLLPWPRLGEMLRQHRLDFPRLRLVLDGKTLPAASYLRHTVSSRAKTQIPRLQSLKFAAELRRGATLVLDAVDELSDPLADLASGLERFFHEHVQINSYAGWHTSRGFDLHWDDHDVFILQVTGRKRWSVYGMTRPWPLPGDGDLVRKPDRDQPIWEGILEDGDLLYIPRGWWHVAVPLDEPTLHLTVGIHNRTGLDLLRWLAGRMSGSEIFRRDLPRFGSNAERDAHVARLRDEMFAAWDAGLLERYFRQLDETAEPRPRVSLPWSATTGSSTELADRSRIRLTAPRPLKLVVEGGIIEFCCLGKHWRFNETAMPLLQLLNLGRTCAVAEMIDAAKPEMKAHIVRRFLRELLDHGLIAIED